MLSVVLTILRFIGITILVILGLLLLAVCLVLFVPVRYRAEGYYKDSYGVKARVSWLLHIVSVAVLLEKEQPFSVKLRIFGITVFDNQKKKEKVKKPKKEKKKKDRQEKQPELAASSVEKKKPADTPLCEKKDIFEEPAEEEKLSIFQRLKLLFTKAVQIFRNIKYTFHRICDTIKEVKANITYYVELFKKDSTKAALEACKKQLLRIGRNLKPQKLQVNLHIGMENPALMGDILGVWGMLYPLHQGHIDISPDFEQPVMEGDFYCKGRITVYVYLWTLMILLFDKNIRRLRKCLVREGK